MSAPTPAPNTKGAHIGAPQQKDIPQQTDLNTKGAHIGAPQLTDIPQQTDLNIKGAHIGAPQQTDIPQLTDTPLSKIVQRFKTMTINQYIRSDEKKLKAFTKNEYEYKYKYGLLIQFQESSAVCLRWFQEGSEITTT